MVEFADRTWNLCGASHVKFNLLEKEDVDASLCVFGHGRLNNSLIPAYWIEN